MLKPRYLEIRYQSGVVDLAVVEYDEWKKGPGVLACDGRVFGIREDTRAYPLPVFREVLVAGEGLVICGWVVGVSGSVVVSLGLGEGLGEEGASSSSFEVFSDDLSEEAEPSGVVEVEGSEAVGEGDGPAFEVDVVDGEVGFEADFSVVEGAITGDDGAADAASVLV